MNVVIRRNKTLRNGAVVTLRGSSFQKQAKAYNTYIAPQAAYSSCSGAIVSQTERAYSL